MNKLPMSDFVYLCGMIKVNHHDKTSTRNNYKASLVLSSDHCSQCHYIPAIKVCLQKPTKAQGHQIHQTSE